MFTEKLPELCKWMSGGDWVVTDTRSSEYDKMVEGMSLIGCKLPKHPDNVKLWIETATEDLDVISFTSPAMAITIRIYGWDENLNVEYDMYIDTYLDDYFDETYLEEVEM